MPEVVEVKKTADFLKKVMKNNYLSKVNILKGRYKTHKPFDLYDKLKASLPLKIIDVKTKGKFMYIVFENGLYLFSTLGLTGGWLYSFEETIKFPDIIEYDADTSKFHKVAINNLNVEFILDNGYIIYFFDSLSFGTLKVIDDEKALTKKLNELGPDIMDDNTTVEIFTQRINKKPDGYIGNVIVNQKLISGIGNYLRSDILWLSKVSPFRKVKTLTTTEIKNIFHSAKVLTWGEYNKTYAINHGIIKKSDKIPGDYERNFFVYMCDKDIYNNPVTIETLYEGSVERKIYWVKDYQL
jgi:formamidopyrimidine-DNA glycosylase